MKRRDFTSAAGMLGLSFGALAQDAVPENAPGLRGTLSADGNRLSIYTPAPVKPTKFFHITDTHLSIDDNRGNPYQEYSKRMAAGYAKNRHFQTGAEYSAKESFALTLERAKKEEVDFLALTGDIFSFPSEAAVEWVLQKLEETGIPFAYVAGNHDWHYEGMEGSARQLRDTWTKKRLVPMYQDKHPLYAAYDLNGVRFICIDNSTYEVLPEQLDFFKSQTAIDSPIVLLMHIPLYMPGRSIGFGCANPDWGEKTDRNFDIERREKWRKDGHTQVTMDFHDAVFNAPNLLLILAGHTHHQSLDIKNGIPQVVSGHNASAFYADVNIRTINQ